MSKKKLPGLGESESAEEFLGAVLAAVPAFITRVDAKYVIRYINLVQRGLLSESVIGADVFTFIAPKYHDVARACFEGVQRTREPASYDSIATGPDGTAATCRNYVAAIDDGKAGVGLCIVGVDVTEQLQRQAALQESEQKLDLAVTATGIGLWDWDLVSERVTWNSRMYTLTGQDTPTDVERYLERVVFAEDRDLVSSRSERMMRTGVFEEYTHRIQRPDGSVRWVLVMGELETNDAGEPIRIVGGMLDVTEQRELEERLRETERQQSLAHLTAGVAHNFNNILMVMMPTLELLQSTVPAENQEDLANALAAARRSADMVRQLMTIGRTAGRRDDDPTTDLEDSLRQLTAAARQILPRAVAFVTVLEDEALQVAMRPEEIEQVLLNLVLNARDAVESTSSPRIEIRARRLPAGEGAQSARIQLEVTDNGAGMPASVKRRIFEPFFTTKRSLGNGLGLSSARALLTQAGGDIACESRLGEGTRFILNLPQATTPPTPIPESSPREASSPRRRVLLVDDEDSVRRMVARVLGHYGFSVLEASSVDAAEALLADEATPPFEVVLLDRSMPHRPGAELLPALRRLAPDAKVLLFSGDPGEAPRGVHGVVSKPVEGKVLVRQIEQVLAAEES